MARNRVHSAISILGLALGISSCMLIALFINDELSYDQHHEKKDRIVRISNILDFNGESHTALSDLATAPTVKQDFPEVEEFVRFRGAAGGRGAELSYNQKVINLQNVWFTDSSVFSVFTYPILNGDPKLALKAPKSIVLTESSAQQFFGNDDPIGKVMKINNTVLTVTAVMADVPDNSEININALISMTTFPEQFHETFNQDWFRIGFYTYLLFKDKPDIAAFEAKMVDFEKKYVQPWSEANQIEAGLTYFATPLNDLHFQNDLEYDLPKGNKNYIYIFGLLALFILIIASINYINLSLAQGNRRAKEIGVRKTLGSSRRDIALNFIGESTLIAVIASILGIALVEISLGTFNSITGKELYTTSLLSTSNLLILFSLIAGVGVIAAIYPAMVLSSFKPTVVLKGQMPNGNGVGIIRKGLIFVQFLFSIFMITGTLLINEQMEFVQSMNLGFDRENVVSIRVPADTIVNKQMPAWVEELKKQSQVSSISLTNMPSGQTGKLMFRVEQDGALKEKTVRFLFVDEQFIEVLGLNVLQGRNFKKEIGTDAQQAFIINEYAAQAFGWNNDALDKRVQWGLLANNQAQNDGKVIGIVNDFNFLSLHNPMEPMILCFNPQGSNTISIRLNEGDYTGLLKQMEVEWNAMAPNHPFDYTFFEDALNRNYQNEQSLSELFNYFSIIAILIASLGLFALVSFTIQSRFKEIGIRKVLGASTAQLSWVLLKDFFLLLIVAFAFTVPINLYLNNYWLSSFAYEAPFNVLNYANALIMALFMAMITVGYHIYQISISDPVYALRYE